MKKEEIRLSACSTQNPSESKQKDVNRIVKEKKDSENPVVSTNTTDCEKIN